MNILLWIVHLLLGLLFLMAGSMKVFAYTKAKESLPWVKDVSKGLVTFIGVAEILGGLGLLLPKVLGFTPTVSFLAALGIAIIMALSSIFHFVRKEYAGIIFNIVLFILALFIMLNET